MATVSLHQLKCILADAAIPGAFVVRAGQPALSSTLSAGIERLCSALAATPVRRLCRSFYHSLTCADGPVAAQCPFGAHVLLVPLDDGFESGTTVAIPLRWQRPSPPALPEECASLSRKAKRRISRALSEADDWRQDDADRLEGQIRRLTDAVAEAKRKATEDAIERTVSDHTHFIAAFSHEALSPIQEIRGLLEKAMSFVGDNPKAHAEVVSAANALQRLRMSLQSMRLLFRDASFQPQSNQFIRIDAHDVVRRWVSIYVNDLKAKELEFISEPASPWWIRVVPEYFELLVRNLLSNAMKYSFTAKEYGGKLIVRFDSANSRLGFVNFGVPIPIGEIESGSIFGLTQRGESARDRDRAGQGVGLYLVKRVADLHSARIEVSSEVRNPGARNEFARTEFAVFFPVPSRTLRRR